MRQAKKLTRRDFLRLCAAAATGAVMASCAPAIPQVVEVEKEVPAEKVEAKPPQKDVKAAVRWWTRGSPEWQETMQDITDAYLEAYPDRDVTLEVMPSERYDDKVLTSAAAGTIADIFHANSEMVVTFGIRGILLDCTPLLDSDTDVDKDDWFDWAWTRFLYKGQIWAMPQKGNVTLTFYNKTLFDQDGVDYPEKGWTWDDYLEASHTLTNAEATQWGTWTFPWHIAVWENGGEIITEDGNTCKLDESAAHEAIQWVADLALKEGVGPKVEERDVFGSLNPFMSGKVGTFVGGESNVGRFIQNVEEFEWAGAWVPKGKELYSEGTSTAFCMYADSKVVDAAWEFNKFLTGDVRAYEQMGPHGKLGVPPHREAFNELFLGTEPRSDVKAILGDMVEYNRVWMRGVTAGAEVKTTVSQGLSRVWSGEQTAAEATKELCGKLNEILADQPR